MGRTNTNIRSYGDVNKTAVVEARCDVRSLAACMKFFTSKDITVFSKSDLVRLIIDTFYNVLINNKQTVPVEDFDEALSILRPLGRTSRDKRAEMHISAFVNKRDYESSIAKDDTAKDQSAFVSGASDIPVLSPEAAKPFDINSLMKVPIVKQKEN